MSTHQVAFIVMEGEVRETHFITMRAFIFNITTENLASLTDKSEPAVLNNFTTSRHQKVFYNGGSSWKGKTSREIINMIEMDAFTRPGLNLSPDFYIICTTKDYLDKWASQGPSLEHFFKTFEMKAPRVFKK